jgi:protoporphyrinogen/coproporphyrinogen III oxidase
MRRVAIVGGGIAGLSAAYYLEKAKRQGAALEWALYEQSERVGGVIGTEYRDGFVLEAGPDSFLSAKPEAADLCRELGLGGELIYSNDSQRKTYILVKGRLTPIPDGLQFMVPTRIMPMATTSLFSLGAKIRMLREVFTAPGSPKGDESVGDFVRRHFGQEMVDRVAEPLLAGVYGGNADNLSIRAVLPRFAEMERNEGSLVRATLKSLQKTTKASPQPLFTSLRRGMQQLVDALVAALPPASFRLRQSVAAIRRVNEEWQLTAGEQTERFDTVFLAAPAPVAAELISDLNERASTELERISYTSSAAVLLACDKPALPPGFGFLVPASEGRKLLACTFVHKKFPDRAPEGTALLRCFFSSARLPELQECSEAVLQSFARQELQEILGIDLRPKFACVFRRDHGLPQYETGHLERVAEIQAQFGKMPGLHLIGNSLNGIGVPDCIRSARLAVDKLVNRN